jgi:hypothetical protein
MSFSRQEQIRVYRGIGSLSMELPDSDVLANQPFLVNARAFDVASANGIPGANLSIEVSATEGASGQDISTQASDTPLDLLTLGRSSADGYGTPVPYVASQGGTYRFTASAVADDYFFPSAIWGMLAVLPAADIFAAVKTLAEDANGALDGIYEVAVQQAQDAEYLLPHVIDDIDKTAMPRRFVESTIRAVVSAGISHGVDRLAPAGKMTLVYPGADKLRDWWSESDLGSLVVRPHAEYRDLVFAAQDSWPKTAVAKTVALAFGASDYDEVIAGILMGPPQSDEYLASQVEEFFLEHLQNKTLTSYTETVFKRRFDEAKQQLQDQVAAAYGLLHPVDAATRDLLLVDLRSRGDWGYFVQKVYRDEADFIHRIRSERQTREESWLKDLDAVKWTATKTVAWAAGCLFGLPLAGAAVERALDGIETAYESACAEDSLRVEGAAMTRASLQYWLAERLCEEVHGNAYAGLLTLEKAMESGSSAQLLPLPKGAMDLDRPNGLWYTETYRHWPCSPVWVSRWAAVTIRNTGTVPAYFQITATRMWDGYRRTDYSEPAMVLIQPNSSADVTVPLNFDPATLVHCGQYDWGVADQDGPKVWFRLTAKTHQGWYRLELVEKDMTWGHEDTPWSHGTLSAAPKTAARVGGGMMLADAAATRDGGVAVQYRLFNPSPYPVAMVLEQPYPSQYGIGGFGEGTLSSSSVIWRVSLEGGQVANFTFELRPLDLTAGLTALSNATLHVSDPTTASNLVIDLAPIALPNPRHLAVSIPNMPSEFLRNTPYSLAIVLTNLLPAVQTTTACVEIADADSGLTVYSNIWPVTLAPEGINSSSLPYISANQSAVVFRVWSTASPSNVLYQMTRTIAEDADTDGMPDYWEGANSLFPTNPADASVDSDGDGLTNLQEYQYRCDPWEVDTDFDGVSDPAEVAAGTNPAYASWADDDDDGLQDPWERRYFAGTASQVGTGDPDHDGLDNAKEQLIGTAPTVADTDGDGQSDFDEYWGGSDPRSTHSTFGILSSARTNGMNRFNVRVGDRSNYRLHAATNLVEGFAPVAAPVPGSSLGTIEMTESALSNSPAFYRIEAMPK